MHLVTLGLQFHDTRRGFAVLGLVEIGAETLAGLLDLLYDLFILLGQPLLYQHVGTVALFRILVVDQRVVERRDVSRSLPGLGVHENRGVDADDILVQFDHRIPPIAFDVVLQLHAVLTVIVHGTESVVYLARGEYETVFLAMGDQLFEKFFLSHRNLFYFTDLPNYKSTK